MFSQILRLKRICWDKNDLNVHVEDLKIWFRKREYPDKLIKEQVVICRRTVITTFSYNNLQLLYADEQVKKVFSSAPFVPFRRTRNLKSYLLRPKIYPLERKVSSEKCRVLKSIRCLVCLDVSERDIFKSFQNKEQYKINLQLNCNDKCLIYLLTCKVCGLQYVSSTTDKFIVRCNKYKENNRKAKRGEEHMQSLVFKHFSSNDHNGFFEDCSIALIDKTDGSDPTRREEWRRVLETVTPYGLNTIGWLFYLGKSHR